MAPPQCGGHMPLHATTTNHKKKKKKVALQRLHSPGTKKSTIRFWLVANVMVNPTHAQYYYFCIGPIHQGYSTVSEDFFYLVIARTLTVSIPWSDRVSVSFRNRKRKRKKKKKEKESYVPHLPFNSRCCFSAHFLTALLLEGHSSTGSPSRQRVAKKVRRKKEKGGKRKQLFCLLVEGQRLRFKVFFFFCFCSNRWARFVLAPTVKA